MSWRHWASALLVASLAGSCVTPTSTPLPTVTPSPTSSAVPLSPSALEQGLPSVASVVERVTPAVVAVSTEEVQSQFFFQVIVPGAGTGVIIRSDGYIVTNNHVIEGAQQVTVTMADGRSFTATVVGRDPEGDLAVIKIDAQDLPTISFGSSDGLRVGDWVIALGNALGLEGGSTVTLGIVSARGRTILTDPVRRIYLFDAIQTDAAINPGNSGGPLVNLQGELVGISTAIESNAQGIGFAIPSEVVKATVANLISSGRVTRAYLGVETEEMTPRIARQMGVEFQPGIVVLRAVSSTPAGRAGLQQGDILIKLGGERIKSDAEFRRALWRYQPRDTVEMEFLRDGNARTTAVTLGERPPTAALLGQVSLA
ncbi:MAG: PDZ domain-containing protein [Dehalococcoidia bacterium]|nr:PDZ domain-containing protein [Dehalococcoidia bacterium]